MSNPPSIHPTAIIDDTAIIGDGTKVWHFCHVSSEARIGRDCTLGQNVFVGTGVSIGNHVKIQNNVSVYAAVTVEDEVFLGPSCVFTNDPNPRAEISHRDRFLPTIIRRGATIGANATIICGHEIGRYAFVAAGAVVAGTVPPYALMVGIPAVQKGWMSRHGGRLPPPDTQGFMRCPVSGWRYACDASGTVSCVDWNEMQPLPSVSPSS